MIPTRKLFSLLLHNCILLVMNHNVMTILTFDPYERVTQHPRVMTHKLRITGLVKPRALHKYKVERGPGVCLRVHIAAWLLLEPGQGLSVGSRVAGITQPQRWRWDAKLDLGACFSGDPACLSLYIHPCLELGSLYTSDTDFD